MLAKGLFLEIIHKTYQRLPVLRVKTSHKENLVISAHCCKINFAPHRFIGQKLR